MKVCLGGTFNILHKGHKCLIDKAFQTAGEDGTVFFGVSKGEKLHQFKKFVKPFDERVGNLKKYLALKKFDKRSVILAIYDNYGLAVDMDFDAIIVSPGTIENAIKINEEREKKGKKPLKIVKISYVLAEDKKPISSTRIFENIIDIDGKTRKH
jgi:pantetheine-phosphate adenylyltransferase